ARLYGDPLTTWTTPRRRSTSTFFGDMMTSAPSDDPPLVMNSDRWMSAPMCPPAIVKPSRTATRTKLQPPMPTTVFPRGRGCPVPGTDEPDGRTSFELVMIVRGPLAPLAVRVQATRTLGKLGPKARVAVPELVRLIGRTRYGEFVALQEAMIDALGQIGAAARP